MARFARNYSGPDGRSSGWFLPNVEELNLIYKNIDSLNLSPPENDQKFWSSSEADRLNAWSVNLLDGTQTVLDKGTGTNTIFVRAF